ncbi:VOC family protein [Caballeronia cordobensis]|uniref:VOC family protein n=1 Tax=Caballeronia cordobensis TaxID=1353886 RepID=UPI00045F088D|nr:glyoxalase/bleomycin resistance protein/dioxygenase [Burkholderia sp. RPE67]
MSQILALRPFVPAQDFALSKRFYEALGFRITHQDDDIAMMKAGSFSFILQNFYVKEFAENCMLQLLVRDVDAWWREMNPEALAGEFGVNPARAPAMQSWGMKVGFVFDPSGVLWHVGEVPF